MYCADIEKSYTHAYLSMRLPASEVSADYYTYPPRIVSLSMLTITYMQAMALHIQRG